jgi:hypothetical protein
VSAGSDFLSAYVWRGITINKSPVAQPWLDVGGIKLGKDVSLGANVWSNLDIGDADGAFKSGEISEIDLTLALTLPKGFKVGYIEYTFPATSAGGGVPGTREVFGSWSKAAIVTPTISLYYDVDEVKDFYGSVSLSKGFALSPKASASLEASAGVAGGDFARAYGGSEGGLFNFNLSGRASYKASDKLTLGGVLGYAGSLDKSHLPKQDANVYGGVNLSIVL